MLKSVQMDDLIQERVAQKENELNATYDEKLRNYEERYAPARIYYGYELRFFASVNRACSVRLT